MDWGSAVGSAGELLSAMASTVAGFLRVKGLRLARRTAKEWELERMRASLPGSHSPRSRKQSVLSESIEFDLRGAGRSTYEKTRGHTLCASWRHEDSLEHVPRTKVGSSLFA